MRPSKDPATMRVGVNLGSAEEEEKAAKVAVTMHETMVRTLNLVRLAAGWHFLAKRPFPHSPTQASLAQSNAAAPGSRWRAR